MRAVVSSSDDWIATAPAIEVEPLVAGLLAMVKAAPPATLTCVRSCMARTATRVASVPTPCNTAPSIKAVVSMLLKLVMMAPAPATEDLGGFFAPAPEPCESEAAPCDCKSPVTASRGAVDPLSALLWELLEPESALSAKPDEGWLGPPAMAAAIPMAPISPLLVASTAKCGVFTKPAAPSAVLLPPASASLSPM